MPGATSGYGLPYPVGGDPLGDGAAEIQNLAEAVEDRFDWLQMIVKSATETVASSAVYQDDDELEFPVLNGAKYVVDFSLLWESAAAASGIKLRWDLPGGSNVYGHAFRQNSAGFDTQGEAIRGDVSGTYFITQESAGLGIGGIQPLYVAGSHRIVAGADGTATLQWAQMTSHATGTKLYQGSWLRVMRVA